MTTGCTTKIFTVTTNFHERKENKTMIQDFFFKFYQKFNGGNIYTALLTHATGVTTRPKNDRIQRPLHRSKHNYNTSRHGRRTKTTKQYSVKTTTELRHALHGDYGAHTPTKRTARATQEKLIKNSRTKHTKACKKGEQHGRTEI